jgi:hypothetical protein
LISKCETCHRPRDARPYADRPKGTVVASLVAARGNDGAGMAGVCWQCTIIPVKVKVHVEALLPPISNRA